MAETEVAAAQETPKPRPQGDPLDTGAAAWQARASLAARNWCGENHPEYEGVDLAHCLEYALVDAINRRYMETLNG